MTTDAKQVPPALSAEEWQEVQRRGADVALETGWRPYEAMAIANAALSDDSPYKITSEDVDLVRKEAELREVMGERRRAAQLFAVAAKLAALLPPE